MRYGSGRSRPRPCRLTRGDGATWAGRGISAVLLLAAAAGCGGETPAVGPQRMDSAGIRIVYSPRPAWAEGQGWRVGEPLLSLGSGDDPLFQVVGAALRPGGGAVVALGEAGEVRFYGAEGQAEATLGRVGEGPGEFASLQSVGLLSGDTAWAFDYALRRFTLLHPEAGVLGVRTLDAAPLRALAVGALPDGGWIVREAWGDAPGALGEGLRRDPIRVFRTAPSGQVTDTLVSLAGREILITSEGGRAVMGAAPFARDATVAVTRDGVAVGDQVEHELRLLDSDGAVRAIARWAGPSLQITEARVSQWIEARLDGLHPGERDRARSYLERAPVPDRSPAYQSVLAAPNGELWVAEYAPPGRAPEGWTVVAPDGGWLGRTVMPAGFTPVDVGKGRILGVERDAMGVERVVIRALER